MTDERASVTLNDDLPLDQAVPSKSKYIAKEDCEPPVLVQIAYMTQDDVEADGQVASCAVLHFNGDIKPFILNNTNKELLKAITGAQTVGQLRNQQVVLYIDPTIMFGRKMVGGVRIRAVNPQPGTQAAYAPPAQDFDDSIPYP